MAQLFGLGLEEWRGKSTKFGDAFGNWERATLNMAVDDNVSRMFGGTFGINSTYTLRNGVLIGSFDLRPLEAVH